MNKNQYLLEIGKYLDQYPGIKPFPPDIQKRVNEIIHEIDYDIPYESKQKYKWWSKEDVQYIIDNQDMSIKELATNLDRKYINVAKKIQKLREEGILPKISKRDRQINKECEYILKNIHLPVNRLAKELGVHRNTVHVRKKRLKKQNKI